MKSLRLLAFFVFSWLFFLFLYAPASLLTPLAEKAGARLVAPEGRLWAGQARLEAAGLSLDRVEWHFLPASLLRLRPAVQVHAELPGGVLDAQVAVTFSGHVEAREVDMALAADSPLLASRIPVPLGGVFNLMLASVDASARGIEALQGELFWEEATVNLGAPEALGVLRVELQVAQGRFTGQLSDMGGPLGVRGQLDSEGGRLRLEALITPRPETSPTLRATLGMLGAPAPDGAIPLRQSLPLPAGVLAPAPS